MKSSPSFNIIKTSNLPKVIQNSILFSKNSATSLGNVTKWRNKHARIAKEITRRRNNKVRLLLRRKNT